MKPRDNETNSGAADSPKPSGDSGDSGASEGAGVSGGSEVSGDSGGSGGRTVMLLQQIRSGQMDASAIGRDDRRLLVAFLMADGYSTAEMAQLLKVSDRSIERDKQAIRQENALPQDPKLYEQMTGRLVGEAELVIQRIRRIVRDKKVQGSVRIDGEHRCYLILSDLVQSLQRLGYLPTASQRVEADLVHHVGELPDIEELSIELQRLRQLSEESGQEIQGGIIELEHQIAHVDLAEKVSTLAEQLEPSAEKEDRENVDQ